jgi:5'-deoxynucleotidase YfbR-like HD superfamily hydrolase
MLKEDTVAQHSFGVAWFCYLLSNGLPSANLLMAALSHDLAEQDTGDIPAPAKRALGIKQQFDTYEDTIMGNAGFHKFALTPGEVRTVKMADCMDGAMRCIMELKMGNHFMYPVLSRFVNYIEELSPTPQEKILLDEILLNMKDV